MTVSDIDVAVERDMRRKAVSDSQPEPDDFCPHCGVGLQWDDAVERGIKLDDLRTVKHDCCPGCGNVMEAQLRDFTVPFLEFVRSDPEAALDTIDSYAELREL